MKYAVLSSVLVSFFSLPAFAAPADIVEGIYNGMSYEDYIDVVSSEPAESWKAISLDLLSPAFWVQMHNKTTSLTNMKLILALETLRANNGFAPNKWNQQIRVLLEPTTELKELTAQSSKIEIENAARDVLTAYYTRIIQQEWDTVKPSVELEGSPNDWRRFVAAVNYFEELSDDGYLLSKNFPPEVLNVMNIISAARLNGNIGNSLTLGLPTLDVILHITDKELIARVLIARSMAEHGFSYEIIYSQTHEAMRYLEAERLTSRIVGIPGGILDEYREAFVRVASSGLEGTPIIPNLKMTKLEAYKILEDKKGQAKEYVKLGLQKAVRPLKKVWSWKLSTRLAILAVPVGYTLGKIDTPREAYALAVVMPACVLAVSHIAPVVRRAYQRANAPKPSKTLRRIPTRVGGGMANG